MLFLLLNVSYFYISILLIIIIVIASAVVFEIPIQECRTWQRLSCWVQQNWYCELEQEERSHIKNEVCCN